MKGASRARGILSRLLDPRVLVGLAITAVTLWFSFRGVDFGRLWQDMARANLALLVLPSVPAYVWGCWVRGLRWRHLAEGVAPIGRGAAFRATAVGFMANNVFPLRIGEVVRAWYLARECSASGTALFGTVIVERLIDAIFVLGLAAVVLGAQGVRARGLDPVAVLTPLAILVAAPIAFIAVMRSSPELVVRTVHRLGGRLLPARFAEQLERALHHLAAGMGGIRSGRSLFWVLVHSAVVWVVASSIPFAAALLALGIELSGPLQLVEASFTILVFVGAAVALPSAPGFFGPYHAACWLALQPYGVSKESAVALGTLAHAVFWITTTGTGLLVLRRRGAGLEETLAGADQAAAVAGPPATDAPPARPREPQPR